MNLRAAGLGLTLVAYAALAYGYITLTPIWQNPDEPAHFNYVAFVARGGGLPELKPGDWDSGLLERVKNGALTPTDDVGAIRYEAWQPPLFYLVAAPIFRLGPADAWSTLVRLRTFDAILGCLTLVVAYAVARHALPTELAVAVPLTLVGIPMFTAVSSSLSADPLANLLAAVILLMLVNGLSQTCVRARWLVSASALIGVGILTKLALGIFVPLALIVVARRWRDAALLLLGTAVVTSPWLVHQVTSYGWADPLGIARHSAVVLDQPRFPGLSVDYLQQFATVSFHSFWAQFGWMAIVAPERLYWIWGGVSIAALVGLILSHDRLRQPTYLLLLGTITAAILAYIAYNLTFQQFQGRYLFTALVPIGILFVAGWAALLPNRLQSYGVLAVGVVLVALNAYALVRVLVPGFAPAS